MEYCAARQREIDGFREISKAVRDLPPAKITGLPGRKEPGDPTGTIAIRAEELARRYDSIIQNLIDDCEKALAFKRAIDEIIWELPVDQQQILELRYQQGHNWTFIAFKRCYSEQHVRRLETDAVDIIATKIQVERL